MTTLCRSIEQYLSFIESPEAVVCREQKQLAAHIRKCFETEDIYVDEEQLQIYLGYQKYFPFKLFPWEKFIFALHNCTYWQDTGLPRWPILFCLSGRGTGKNGYLSFETFCYISPGNGIKEYDVDIFASSEDQAKTSFDDVYRVLENNKTKLSKFFTWTKELITCTKTSSRLRFRTSGSKTKDGGRPGAVVFDEYHTYENPKLINVAITGLGKKKHPRRSIFTTDGDIRDGELDKLKDKAKKILEGRAPDNGMLPFICKLDDISEIHDPSKWVKANPTLAHVGESEYADNLLSEIKLEYIDYADDPISHSAFATKRMNIPQGDKENEVTDFENLKIASRPLADLNNRVCVFGTDSASTTDFFAAGFMFLIDGEIHWLTHSWICKQSKDLHRIRFPYLDSEARGECTIVDAPEIPMELPAEWYLEIKQKYNLTVIAGAIDHFRYTLISKALSAVGFVPERKERGTIKGDLKLIRPSDIMMIAPSLCLEFARHKVVFGDNMLMRWYVNNAKKVVDKKGNITFEKIEPKSRKTDGFMAYVAARTLLSRLEAYDCESSDIIEGVWNY